MNLVLDAPSKNSERNELSVNKEKNYPGVPLCIQNVVLEEK